MRLRNLTFDTWLRSHNNKNPEERWLRELYPWPVLAQVDCDKNNVGQTQTIAHDGVDYDVTLASVRWQQQHGTFRYRVKVEADGMGWHSRSFSDEFDLCGTPDGIFVTLFHAKTEEPLEKIARAFFCRRWEDLKTYPFESLAVSRFLAASIVSQVAEEAFRDPDLVHYPGAKLVGNINPMFANERKLWVGYRFFSEDAYSWARKCTGNASKIVALYFADTKYQFRTDLPSGTEVISITQLDATELGSRYEDLIQVLLRRLDLPVRLLGLEQLTSIVVGQTKTPQIAVAEADVHEALAALKRPCSSKPELRYQLAAAVVLSAWIENERHLGLPSKKKFYAFKYKIGALVKWANEAKLPNVTIWAENLPIDPILYIRIDDVDFSFRAIPGVGAFLAKCGHDLKWRGVRLKPIAPIVLAWARAIRSP